MNTGAWRLGILLSGALLAMSAAAADLTLFADDDYQGRSVGVVIDERELSVLNFDKRTSSVVVERGTWTVCTGEDYTGQCIDLEPGKYASLQAIGLDNSITSVRRRDVVSIGNFQGADAVVKAEKHGADQVVLYSARDYQGASHGLDKSQPDVRADALQNAATSVVIASGQWELCDGTYFRGQCVTLGPGKYPSMEAVGLTHGVSSARREAEAPHHTERAPKN
jgi:hypothetical protein